MTKISFDMFYVKPRHTMRDLAMQIEKHNDTSLNGELFQAYGKLLVEKIGDDLMWKLDDIIPYGTVQMRDVLERLER